MYSMFSFTHSKVSHAHSQAEAHVQKTTIDLEWVHCLIIGMAGHSWDFPLKLHPQYFRAVYKPPHSSSASTKHTANI
jgi:hypothetical protein